MVMRWCMGTLATVLLLSSAARADEAEVAKRIEKLGGTVLRDEQQPGNPVVGVDLTGASATDADLKDFNEFKQLTALTLTATKVTDSGLKELKKIKQLTDL